MDAKTQTKYWLAGAAIFAFLVIVRCMKRKPVQETESGQPTDEAPYYMTYNVPDTTGTRGGYNFGDIMVQGSPYIEMNTPENGDTGTGNNGGCCDPCAASQTSPGSGGIGGITFPSMDMLSTLPWYISNYVSKPLDSLTYKPAPNYYDYYNMFPYASAPMIKDI